MDSIIKVTLPKSACAVQITTAETTKVTRVSISVQVPAGTVCIVVDGHWHSADLWEKDMRLGLETLVNRENAIVQARIANTTTEDDRRIRAVLCNILGINN